MFIEKGEDYSQLWNDFWTKIRATLALSISGRYNLHVLEPIEVGGVSVLDIDVPA
jgi:hypothetical protein